MRSCASEISSPTYTRCAAPSWIAVGRQEYAYRSGSKETTWDLDPKQAGNPQLIAPCAEAGFLFESFNPARLGNWRTYWKRMVRYGRRSYEFALLGPRLKAGGLAAMPRDIREIYGDADNLRLKWDGIYTITNWFALRQMRDIAQTMAKS